MEILTKQKSDFDATTAKMASIQTELSTLEESDVDMKKKIEGLKNQLSIQNKAQSAALEKFEFALKKLGHQNFAAERNWSFASSSTFSSLPQYSLYSLFHIHKILFIAEKLPAASPPLYNHIENSIETGRART